MGIFNGVLNKRPTFGQVPGMGMMQPQMQQPLMQPQMAPQAMQPGLMESQAPMPAKKPGPNWAGIAADFLAGMAGQPGQFAEQQQHERAMQQRQQMAEQERLRERDDFIWKSQYERANPKPVNNDTVNDLNWYKNLSEEDRKLYHQMKPVVGYMADGTPRIINPMEVGQPNRGPKPGTIEDGHEFIGGNPADPKSWRKVGGQPAGASPFVQ